MHATTVEALDAYQALTPNQLKAIHTFAKKRLRAPYSEPLDLVHEALDRTLDGRRSWKLGIAFSQHMIQTIRSISGHDASKAANDPSRSLSLQTTSVAATPECAIPSVEEQVMLFEQIELARKAAERVKRALVGDELARKVLEGMLAGLSPKETCEAFGMSALDFDSARHRVMRRLCEGAMH